MEWFKIEDKPPPLDIELIFKYIDEDLFYLGKIKHEYSDRAQCCQCGYPEYALLDELSHWAYLKFEGKNA